MNGFSLSQGFVVIFIAGFTMMESLAAVSDMSVSDEHRFAPTLQLELQSGVCEELSCACELCQKESVVEPKLLSRGAPQQRVIGDLTTTLSRSASVS